MSQINFVRSQVPRYKDLSDREILEDLAKVTGSDIGAVARDLNFQVETDSAISDAFTRSFGGTVQGLGSSVRDLPGGDLLGRVIQEKGKDIVFDNPARINSADEFFANPGTGIAEGIGELGGSLATGIPLGIAGGLVAGPAGAYAGFAAPTAFQTYGESRESQRELGIDDKGRALEATGLALIPELLMGPSAKVARGIARIGKTPVAGTTKELLGDARRLADKTYRGQIARKGTSGFFQEGGQEIFQSGATRYGGYKDLESDEAFDEYALSGLLGGVGGGVLGGAIGARSLSKARGIVAEDERMAREYDLLQRNKRQAEIDANTDPSGQQTLFGQTPVGPAQEFNPLAEAEGSIPNEANESLFPELDAELENLKAAEAAAQAEQATKTPSVKQLVEDVDLDSKLQGVASSIGLTPTVGSDGTIRGLTVGDKTLGSVAAKKYLAKVNALLESNPTVSNAILEASKVQDMPRVDLKLLRGIFQELGVNETTTVEDVVLSLDAKIKELAASKKNSAAQQQRLYTNIKNVVTGGVVDETVIDDPAQVLAEQGSSDPTVPTADPTSATPLAEGQTPTAPTMDTDPSGQGTLFGETPQGPPLDIGESDDADGSIPDSAQQPLPLDPVVQRKKRRVTVTPEMQPTGQSDPTKGRTAEEVAAQKAGQKVGVINDEIDNEPDAEELAPLTVVKAVLTEKYKDEPETAQRKIAVLEALIAGKKQKDIAAELGFEDADAVGTFLKNLRKELGIVNENNSGRVKDEKRKAELKAAKEAINKEGELNFLELAGQLGYRVGQIDLDRALVRAIDKTGEAEKKSEGLEAGEAPKQETQIRDDALDPTDSEILGLVGKEGSGLGVIESANAANESIYDKLNVSVGEAYENLGNTIDKVTKAAKNAGDLVKGVAKVSKAVNLLKKSLRQRITDLRKAGNEQIDEQLAKKYAAKTSNKIKPEQIKERKELRKKLTAELEASIQKQVASIQAEIDRIAPNGKVTVDSIGKGVVKEGVTNPKSEPKTQETQSEPVALDVPTTTKINELSSGTDIDGIAGILANPVIRKLLPNIVGKLNKANAEGKLTLPYLRSVALELAQSVKEAGIRFSKKVAISDLLVDNKVWTDQEYDQADAKLGELMAEVFAKYNEMGLDAALSAGVSEISVGDLSLLGARGLYLRETKDVLMDIASLLEDNPIELELTLHHEVIHAADYAEGPQAKYSSLPEFRVSLTPDGMFAGNPNAHGPIVKEMLNAMRQFEAFDIHFEYPVTHKWDTKDEAASEVLAQVWALYAIGGKGREALKALMPNSYATMERIAQDLQEGTSEQTKPTEAAAEGQTVRYSKKSTDSNRRSVGESLGAGQGSKKSPTNVKNLQRLIDDKLPSWAGGPLNNVISTIADYTKRGSAYLAPTRDLVDMLKNVMPKEAREAAEQIAKLFDQKNKEIFQLNKRYEDVVKDYQKLSNAEKVGLNAVIKKATLDKDNDYQSKKDYKALSKAAQDIVDRVFTVGKEDAKKERDNVIAELERNKTELADDPSMVKRIDESIKEIKQQYSNLLAGPYAPLMRYGDYLVVAKSEQFLEAQRNKDWKKVKELESSGDDYVVEFFESAGERDKRARQLEDEGFAADNVISTNRDKFRSEALSGPAVMEAMNKIRALTSDVNENADEVTQKSVKRVNNLLEFVYLQGLSENNIRNSRRVRKNIEGADTNMMKAFATGGQARSRYIAGLKLDAQINRTFRTVRSQIRSLDGREQENARRLSTELFARHIEGTKPPPTLTNGILRLGSIYHLATSPSYYLINMTQPHMVTLPFLAGKYDYMKAANALNSSYTEVMAVLKGAGVEGDLNVDNIKDPTTRKYVQQIIDEGWLNVSDVLEAGQFEDLDTNGNPITKPFKAADRFLRGVQQRTEVANRIASAVAALKLSNGDMDYAKEVVDRTQGDYSDWNAPRFMRTPIGKIATQFRKFQLMQGTLLVRLFNESFGEKSPERDAARVALKYMLAHSILAAGVNGIPAMGAVMALAQLFGADEDEPEDYIRELFGNNGFSDLLVGGVPKALPLVGFDISKRVGLGQTFSIFPYADMSFTPEGLGETALAAAGPIGGVLTNYARAAGYLGTDQYYKAAEAALPNGIANLSKAIRQSAGGITNTKGDMMVKPDDYTFVDGFLKGLGLNSSKESFRLWAQNQAYQTTTRYRDAENSLRTKFAIARKDGDTSEMRDLRAEWQEIQKEKRELGLKVSPVSRLLESVKRQREREQQTINGVRADKNTRRYVQQLTQ